MVSAVTFNGVRSTSSRAAPGGSPTAPATALFGIFRRRNSVATRCTNLALRRSSSASSRSKSANTLPLPETTPFSAKSLAGAVETARFVEPRGNELELALRRGDPVAGLFLECAEDIDGFSNSYRINEPIRAANSVPRKFNGISKEAVHLVRVDGCPSQLHVKKVKAERRADVARKLLEFPASRCDELEAFDRHVGNPGGRQARAAGRVAPARRPCDSTGAPTTLTTRVTDNKTRWSCAAPARRTLLKFILPTRAAGSPYGAGPFAGASMQGCQR
jgi:hypothetical protein